MGKLQRDAAVLVCARTGRSITSTPFILHPLFHTHTHTVKRERKRRNNITFPLPRSLYLLVVVQYPKNRFRLREGVMIFFFRNHTWPDGGRKQQIILLARESITYVEYSIFFTNSFLPSPICAALSTSMYVGTVDLPFFRQVLGKGKDVLC